MVLIVFYGGFYYLSNYAWVTEIDIPINDEITISQISTTPLYPGISKEDRSVKREFSPKTTDQPEKRTQTYNAQAPHPKPNQNSYSKKLILINKANQDDWETLYNIGPYRAERIINFRKALGGFYSVDQVRETYALPDSVFMEIKPQLKIDSDFKLKLIDLNTTTYDSLYQHPYITRQMAYFIVKAREKDLVFQNMEEIYTIIKEKDHERLRKLEPYLDFGIK